MTKPAFLYNQWYVAGWSADLAPGDRIARKFLNRPIVLWRSEAGKAYAMDDRCAHRAMALSAGPVVGDAIRCPYHGMEYGGDGRCTHIPAQDKIPDVARVRAYPLIERQGLLWIWMGDETKADEALVADYPVHTDPKLA